MVLRFGLLALGVCTLALGLIRHSTGLVIAGVVLMINAAALFQTYRKVKQWQDDAGKLPGNGNRQG